MIVLINLKGRRFGRWKISDRAGRGLWHARCRCGTERPVRQTHLLRGESTSCGCLRKENLAKSRRLRPYESLYHTMLQHAKERKLAVDVSYEDFLEYIKQNHCHYCGADIKWDAYRRSTQAYNLDRKDNEGGYLKSNIVVACTRCNKAKSNHFSYEEWLVLTASRRMGELELAIYLATAAHVGQVDADEQPHIVHALDVLIRVKQDSKLEQSYSAQSLQKLLISAVLHDTVEDSEGRITLDMIERWFGPDVRAVVDALSRRKDEPYRDFIYRARQNPSARVIKIADVQSNLGRTHKIDEAKWRNKLEYKYGIAIRVLTSPVPTTWEQQSWQVAGRKCYMADPNGKEIEVTPEELRAATHETT